jgi:tRNA (cmo5U34)-methyltransferase
MDYEVGHGIEKKSGRWEFSSEIVDEFDDHIRMSIPIYNEVQKYVPIISDWFLNYTTSTSRIYDLGCSTGETCRNLAKYHDSDNLEIVGLDVQKDMLIEARKKNSESENVDFVLADITNFDFRDADFVVSLFTLGFIPEVKRIDILRRLFDQLNPGGGLLIVEKTLAENSFAQDIYNQVYSDYKIKSGFDQSEVLAKKRSLRGQLRPLTISNYNKIFQNVGFVLDDGYSNFIKWFPWTGWILRKPT